MSWPPGSRRGPSRNSPARPKQGPIRRAAAPWPAHGDAAQAFLVAQSLGIAGLAGRLATQLDVDAAAAYLLGLLHAATRWLDAAGGSATGRAATGETATSTAAGEALPGWLTAALAEIARPGATDERSVAGCVARALALADDRLEAGKLPADFAFDRDLYASQLALARVAWLRPGVCGDPGALAVRLKRLAELAERFELTLEREKLESLKELAYGAGHEINNPLANISARAQTLLTGERDADRRRLLAAINAQAFRAHEMIADMMLFARPPEMQVEPFDLAELVAGMCSELAPQAAAQGSELVGEIAARPLIITGDKTQLAVALRALCINALEALTSGGHVLVALAESSPLGELVQIAVSDNGPGIPRETPRHIFDPFFSGREAGRGLGFGLSKCWRIVTLHGGRVEVDSPGDAGARFTITLPRVAVQASRA